MAEQQQRQTAFKTWIIDIIRGKYFVEEGWTPNYILTQKNKKISRLNIISTIINISKEDDIQQFIYVDDGSAEIAIRSFNEINYFKGLKVGDIIQIIGKVRTYNDEKYIVPEIIKKINNTKWLIVRKLELGEIETKIQEEKINPELIKKDTETPEKKSNNEIDPILEKIKELDNGDGADFQEIVKLSNEQTINNLLMNGEIFELKPGKLKVLE
ncbi:MAG: OB-fold nucleic acid binding domain-containing protein [Nanoarchaeota archaeon]|nr:OB-fold nucleic acid binding domain-containing protein [Nanoarchaeota archaeon]